MKIAISGASGFIGRYLSQYFIDKGHTIFPLSRKSFEDEFNSELIDILSQSDVVINLAGAPINRRWTKAYKKELYDSRIITTRKLVNAINHTTTKPKVLISTSAVGYYPSEGYYDEYNSIKGNGFLSNLCEQWEKEATKVSSDVRLVITRFGVVLAAKGGAFDKMMLPARFGVATIIARGDQPFPWIDIEDLALALEHIIGKSTLDGEVNLVAPQQISNRELMLSAVKYYNSIFIIRIPAFVFRVLLGESAEFITEGQRVYPRKLLDSGFIFKTKTISDFFQNLPK